MKPVKRNNLVLLTVLFPLLFLWNCYKQSVNDEIAAKIYVEKIYTEEKYSYNIDSIKYYHSKIFKKYKTDSLDYNNYLVHLKSDQTKWDKFFKQANSYLNEMKSKGEFK